MIILGGITFVAQLTVGDAGRAWQTYLINFLFWSAIAQGGLLFAIIMHLTRARWSGPMQRISESFVMFFPISLVLFLIIFAGKDLLFPWLHEDLHGKELWLNMPFLFARDLLGLIILYGLGFGYVRYSMMLNNGGDEQQCRDRMTRFSVLYAIGYALVLTLIGFDLVMSMDPHWFSTLFGAYIFVKAFYIGLGGLIILSALLHLGSKKESILTPDHFHNIGKLFFGFCLVWADFFYCQFVVIWYGNLPEETSYIILRTMVQPWQSLSWIVFTICFIAPFFILLNKNIKKRPTAMLLLCIVILGGIWLEHVLLLGPILSPSGFNVGITEILISFGFFGMMAMAIYLYINRFGKVIFRKTVHKN
ncbi:MAG: hypothetical protein K9L30_11885 [Desulfobacterales bacterium]|nr:hypothetical protein [Desulfobacterales bacterium]